MRLNVQRDDDAGVVRVLVGESAGSWVELDPEEAINSAGDIERAAEHLTTDAEPESDFAGNPDPNQLRFGELNGGRSTPEDLTDHPDDPIRMGESRNPADASKW